VRSLLPVWCSVVPKASPTVPPFTVGTVNEVV
jgi:hypothetical protein